jgi:hypothetical protein
MTSSTSNSEKPTTRSQLQALKRFTLRILLPFAVVVIVVCGVLDWVVRTQLIAKTPSHGAAKLSRVQAENPGEIPIFGSSRALGSYIPDTLGPQFYNYGMNGIGYGMMDVFVKLECAKKGKTTPIVLNFDYDMFVNDVGDPDSYLPHSHLQGVRKLVGEANLYSWWWRIPGIRYFGSIDGFMKERLNERLQLTKSMNKGAAIEKNVLAPAAFAKLVQQRRDSVHLWRPRRDLLDSLQLRIGQYPHRKFCLVVGPYHQAYYSSFASEGFREAQKALARLDSIPNCIVIRIEGRDWPDGEFLNTTHVSYSGAGKFSRMLRDSLQIRGLIPPQNTVPSAQ